MKTHGHLGGFDLTKIALVLGPGGVLALCNAKSCGRKSSAVQKPAHSGHQLCRLHFNYNCRSQVLRIFHEQDIC